MAVDDPTQRARWTDPTSLEYGDISPEDRARARRANRAWRQYQATGEITELVKLGILSDPDAPEETE